MTCKSTLHCLDAGVQSKRIDRKTRDVPVGEIPKRQIISFVEVDIQKDTYKTESVPENVHVVDATEVWPQFNPELVGPVIVMPFQGDQLLGLA